MKRLAVAAPAAAVLAALVATSALAKGASEATVTGPGLGSGISLTGEGQAGGGRLMQLAEDAGFFPAVFATSPNPMLSTRPAGELGHRYTITYEMPGPTGGPAELRQDIYPFAKPSPVTYLQPGQRYFGTEKTVGGWYVASTALKDDLVAVGLPESPPDGGGGSALPWTVIEVVGAAMVAVAASIGAVILARRRWPGGRQATT